MRVSLAPLQLTAQPFPVGCGRGVFAPDFYSALLAEWPDTALFHERTGSVARKRVFSQFTDDVAYRDFFTHSPAWSAFSDEMRQVVRAFRVRLEFSETHGDGGYLRPHVDAPDKLAALIFPMVQPGAWRAEWGGGTSICVPKDPARMVPSVNSSYLDFDEVNTLRTYPFDANQCLLLVRTPSAWHHVAPVQAPIARCTVTVALERR
jgi:hypothetical protein